MASRKRRENKKHHQHQRKKDRAAREAKRDDPRPRPRERPRPPVPDDSDYVFTFVSEADLGRSETTLDRLRQHARRLPFEPAMLHVARLQGRVEPVLNEPAGHLAIAHEFYADRTDLLPGFERELAGQTTRTIFSPQGLTLLARILIDHAKDEPMRELTAEERRRLQDAVFGAHSALEVQLERLPLPTEEAKLAYELQAATFFRRPPWLEEMARHRELLLLATGNRRLATSPNQVPVNEWLASLGLSADRQWVLGFGLLAGTQAPSDQVRPHVPTSYLDEMVAKLGLDKDAALPTISSSRAEFQSRFAALGGGQDSVAWELRPFKATPFLRLASGGLLLMSPPWLLSWLGEGFHYRALTVAQQNHGSDASAKYTRLAGEVAERYALDLAEAAAQPATLVMGEQSYGRHDERTSDVAILIGHELLVFEVHARRVAATAAVTGGAADATLEVSRLLVGKIDQLGVAIGALLSGEALLPGVEMGQVERIWPFVVSASYVRQSPYLWEYLRMAMDPAKTQSLEDGRVKPLQVLDIESYEKLMGFLHAGEDVPALLVRKTAPKYRDRDLAVWFTEDPGAPSEAPRLPVLTERWEKMSNEVNEAVRLTEEAAQDDGSC
ncbi:MAG TPA: hypothetical protein VHT27_13210 [Solirubrobacteraceae bacterium]|nr:hypothetical protein [Solirubrobacteraceae bacterium]